MKRLLPALLLMLFVPTPAAADGPPVTDVPAGPEGVVEQDGSHRLVALPAATETILVRSRVRDGEVGRATSLDGRWGVPVVTEDGGADGLSADAETLVLARPQRSYPPRSAAFAAVDVRSFSLRRVIRLKGWWGFDALSPDGRWLYLVQQLSRRNRSRYAVRAYDLVRGRLMPEPVVDPSEPDEPMRGFPLTRTTEPGGRWVYTLYGGAGGHPFVHALDTRARRSICIDLPHRLGHGSRLFRARLELRGNRVRVVTPSGLLAAPVRTPPEPVQASAGGSEPVVVVTVLAGLALAAAALRRRRRAA